MKKHALMLASVLALASCTTKVEKPESADLVLLYTTDVHGACLPYDFKQDQLAEVSLANVYSYVKQERQANPDKVMLFDTGDFLQGQPSIYYYNFVDTTSQHAVARIYNYMGYDAVGFGNHDVEPGEDVYLRRLPKMFDMPWICANAIKSETGTPMFDPYAIIERQGLKIAVLGLITPNIHSWLPKTLWADIEFEDMVECAQKWIPIIKEREQPDLIIGLFHAGHDYTVGGNNLDTRFNENGSIPVAIKVPGFDLVLLGHDHDAMTTEVVNVEGDTVKVLDAGTAARYIGRADIHLERQADGTYSKTIETRLIESKQHEADPEFCNHFVDIVKTVEEYIKEPIGTLTESIYGIDGLYGPCKFSDLIHDAQLWATNADVSMSSVLSPYDMIPEGKITLRHLFSIYKFENQLFTLRMTGADIKNFIEYGFSNQFATMHSPNDPLINRGKDGKPVTPSFNYTSAAGIRYVVDITKPAGERVKILSMSDGSRFSMDKDYSVAINSYQASGGGGFIPVGLGWDAKTLEEHTIDTTPLDVRSYIASYIKEKGVITPRLRGDWEIIPTDLWKAGKEREIASANRSFR